MKFYCDSTSDETINVVVLKNNYVLAETKMNNSENNNVILYKIHSINLCIDSAKDDYTKILY